MPLSLTDAPPELQRAVETLRATPEVQGVVLVGSRSRGFADSASDYDLEVIVDDAFFDRLEPMARLALVWDGQPRASRLIGDMLTQSRSHMERKRASPLDVDHWPYEAAALWHDRDGDIAPLLAALGEFPEADWETRLQLHYVDFWYHAARATKTASRGSALNHALVIGQAAHGYLKCIFVLNRRWPPLVHWAEQSLKAGDLALRPTDDVALLTEALTTLDPAPLRALHDALDPLLDSLGLRWHHDRVALLLHVFGPDFYTARARWPLREIRG